MFEVCVSYDTSDMLFRHETTIHRVLNALGGDFYGARQCPRSHKRSIGYVCHTREEAKRQRDWFRNNGYREMDVSIKNARNRSRVWKLILEDWSSLAMKEAWQESSRARKLTR